jgi:hypothetical protein
MSNETDEGIGKPGQLQNQGNAAAGFCKSMTSAKPKTVSIILKVMIMKTKHLKLEWLIPSLGITLLAAGVLATAVYLNLERRIHAGENLAATLDNLAQDQRLSAALRTIHDGDVTGAAQRLDLLLCESILVLNSQLASADDQTRAYVVDAFRRIGRVRPKNPEASANSSACETSEDQVAAQRILALAMAGDIQAK